MSETEAVIPQHSRYEAVAYGRGETPVYYEEFGSYQGEWVMLAKGPEGFSIYKGSYGSCSGCDSYEAEHNYAEQTTLGWARNFAKDYEPYCVIPFGTMETLCRERTLIEVLPKNLRDEFGRAYEDLPGLDAVAASFMVGAKLDQGWSIIMQDIAAAQNQELRARALKVFGYERWIDEVGARVLDASGTDELVQAGDMVFAHVKDSSTDRRYLLRVPPTMTTLHQAIAWTFGYEGDAAKNYRPTRES